MQKGSPRAAAWQKTGSGGMETLQQQLPGKALLGVLKEGNVLDARHQLRPWWAEASSCCLLQKRVFKIWPDGVGLSINPAPSYASL